MVTRQVDWIGRQVADGRYRVVEGLDRGSMGHVYRAHDRRLEADVVLKFPVPADSTMEGPDFLERFSREIRSLVQLSHPHIVRIIDVGAEDGHPYVVMQYLTGGASRRGWTRVRAARRYRWRPDRWPAGCPTWPRPSTSSTHRTMSIAT